MSSLFELEALQRRLQSFARDSLGGGVEATRLVAEALRRGELPRGEATRAGSRSERSARATLRKLTDAGLLVSDTPKGPVRLNFSSSSADVLFPRLFPAQLGP
jgi:Fic family protein